MMTRAYDELLRKYMLTDAMEPPPAEDIAKCGPVTIYTVAIDHINDNLPPLPKVDPSVSLPLGFYSWEALGGLELTPVESEADRISRITRGMCK